MRLLPAACGLLTAAIVSSLGGPSLSSAVFSPVTRHTDLGGRSCEIDPAAQGRDGGEQIKRCPGLGGARTVVTAGSGGVALGFEWSGRERAEEVLRDRSLGRGLEWRGLQTSRGFDPFAVTVPVMTGERTASGALPILAVLRVRRGEACVIGVVDLAANPTGHEIATRLADERARAASCGREPVRIEGTPTRRAEELARRL